MTKGQIAMVAAMVNNYHRAGIPVPAGGTAKNKYKRPVPGADLLVNDPLDRVC
jgi:hypothetical protein